MSLPSRLLGANPSIQVSTLLSGSLSTPSAKGVFIPPGVNSWASTSLGYTNARVERLKIDPATGKAFSSHSDYATGPTNTAYYWSNISTNSTPSTVSKGENLHVVGHGYDGSLFYSIGGSSDQYHGPGDDSVYTTTDGSSYTTRTSTPNVCNRLQVASDQTNGVFILPGYKDNSGGLTAFYQLATPGGTWSTKTSIPKSYRQQTALAASGGKMLASASWTDSTDLACYQYSISGNTWATASNLPSGNTGQLNSDSVRFYVVFGATAYYMENTGTTWSAAQTVTGTSFVGSGGDVYAGKYYEVYSGLKTT